MSFITDDKAFKGVVFDDKSTAVVYKDWIVIKQHKVWCWWPTSGSPQELSRNKTPPLMNWLKFACRVVASAKTFSKCDRRLDGITTDESSTETSEGVSHARKVAVAAPSSLLSSTPSFTPHEDLAPVPTTQSSGISLTEDQDTKLILKKILTKLAMIESSQKRLEEDIKKIKSLICQDRTQERLPPAKTMEELHTLISSDNIVPTLLSEECLTLRNTLRKMLQRLMTKSLAASFSFSGLGLGRKPVKVKFSTHQAYFVIQDALQWTRHRDVCKATLNEEISVILRQVPDWSGGRKRVLSASNDENKQPRVTSEATPGPVAATPEKESRLVEAQAASLSSSEASSAAVAIEE